MKGRYDKILNRIDANIKQLLTMEKNIMSTLADIQAEVAAMETEVTSAVAALKTLAASAADPTAINDIATRLQAAHDSLQAAVDAAVPPKTTAGT